MLLDDAGMLPLVRRYFGAERTTDVISFRYAPSPADAGLSSGEIVVNVERARAQGRGRGGASAELALYLAHGCDHLMGQTDATAAARLRMRRRERRWLRQAREAGLAHALIADRRRGS